jgi:hypothetical protein
MSDDVPKVNYSIVVVCITILFIFVVAGCVVAFVAVPNGANTASLITILIGSLAPTIASIGALVVSVRTKEHTSALLNGRLEAKIEDVLRRVLVDGFDRHGTPVSRHRALPNRDLDTVDEYRANR